MFVLVFLIFLIFGLQTSLGNLGQNWCLAHLPSHNGQEFVAALFCGKLNMLSFEHLKSLQYIGVVHFFVISGFHMNLYYKILNFFNRYLHSPIVNFIALSFVLILAGFPVASLRAYFFLVLQYINGRQKLFWPSLLQQFFAVFIVIALQPKSWNSLGLHLSWMASTIVCINLFSRQFLNLCLHCFLLYFIMGELLSSFTTVYVWQFPIAYLFSPIFNFFILPFSFLSIWSSHCGKFLYSSFSIFSNFLQNAIEYLTLTNSYLGFNIQYIFPRSLGIFFLLYMFYILWRRKFS